MIEEKDIMDRVDKIIATSNSITIEKEMLDKEENKVLIEKALKESKQYTDIRVRESIRKARREEKMIRKSNLIAKISIVCAFLGLAMVALSEGAMKYPEYTESNAIHFLIAFGVCLLAGSLTCMLMSEKIQDAFYKTKFTIYYKDRLGHDVFYEEYSTRATSAAKAIARFYSLTDMRFEPYKVMDEFGTLYDNDGKPSKKNYNKEHI